jgi:ABC-2 type transport system permease protein
VGLQAQLISFYTLVRREFMRIIRIWPETLLPSVITMGLYFVIFGTVMGERIGSMGDIHYTAYIVPGLVMMALVNSSFINVMFSFYISKFQRNIEEMLTSPMSNHAILLGYMCGGIIRGILVASIVLLVSLFFTDVIIYDWHLTLVVAMCTAAMLSLCGFINGVFAKSFDQLSLVPMFVLTPLTYFGGVFYSVDLLPPFWQNATYFNPIFYMVSGFRYGMLGIADVAIEYVLIVLIIAISILYGFCMWLLHKGIGVKS